MSNGHVIFTSDSQFLKMYLQSTRIFIINHLRLFIDCSTISQSASSHYNYYVQCELSVDRNKADIWIVFNVF